MNHIADIQTVKNSAQISSSILLRWPTLLAYLDLESLYTQLPTLNFQACLEVLKDGDENQAIDLFDRLFAENITLIKGLPEIDPSFLLEAIVKKQSDKRFLFSLKAYEERFRENTPYLMHDLILYLSWERMCITVSCLFDMQVEDLNFLRNLKVIKECLKESYLHIVKDGKTHPSLYRLLEALFYYHMREENLQGHTDEEWAILNQSFPVLKDQNTLADVFYIDDMEDVSYITLDSPDIVNARLAFADCMLKKELPDLRLSPKRIIYEKIN